MSTEPLQPKLHYETLNDALHDLVLALDGYKRVGPRLWPEKSTEDAAQLLRHCLTPARREKLSPEQLQLLLRWGRDASFHGAKYYIDDDAGYNRTMPVDPKEERSRAIAAVESAATALERATAALERTREAERIQLSVAR